jgi:hypothetical protein
MCDMNGTLLSVIFATKRETKREIYRDLNFTVLPFKRESFVKARTVPYPTPEPFFVILTLKPLFRLNLLEKREPFRDAFLYEKAFCGTLRANKSI